MADGDLLRPDPMRVNPVYLRKPAEPESPYSSMTPIGNLVQSDEGWAVDTPPTEANGGRAYVPFDPAIHIGLKDPVTGTVKVYAKPGAGQQQEARPGVGVLPSPDAPGLAGVAGRIIPGLDPLRWPGAIADAAQGVKQMLTGEVPISDPLTGGRTVNPEAVQKATDVAGWLASPSLETAIPGHAAEGGVVTALGARPRRGGAAPVAEVGPNPAVARGPGNPAEFARTTEVALPNGETATLHPVDGDPFGPAGARPAGSAPPPAVIDGVPVERAGLSPVAQQLAIAHAAGDSPVAEVVKSAQAVLAKAATGDQAAIAAMPRALEHLSAAEELKGRDIQHAPANVVQSLGIVAYHGTPHDFDQFDIGKIGTGEGAQAYGHGMYFAENPGVAGGYKDRLSGNQTYVENGKNVGHVEIVDRIAKAIKEAVPGTVPDHVRTITKYLTDALEDVKSGSKIAEEYAPPVGFEKQWNAALEQIKNVEWDDNPGHLYQVRINADPEHFLDWDKPLSEQHPVVQDAYAKARGFASEEAGRFLETQGDRSGMSLYTDVGLGTGAREIQPAASEALSAAGVPGIKYLDQGSRFGKSTWNVEPPHGGIHEFPDEESARSFMGAFPGSKLTPPPKPTANYVVFNDKHVEITHKNGQPFQRVEHNPFTEEAPALSQGEEVKAVKPGTTIQSIPSAPMVRGGSVLPSVRVPAKLYRGIVKGQQESGVEGLGTAHLGRGLYSSPDRSFAKMYGEPTELDPAVAFPSNPLILRGAGGAGNLLMDWVFRNSDFRNAREFNAAHPDPASFVRKFGFDGVVAGDEVVKYPPAEAPAVKAAEVAPVKAEPPPEPVNQPPAPAPTFYSAVGKAVDAAKTEKASPNQWLATIKNTPGVKAAELDWMGLEPWLKDQKGSVTRQEVSDFIRANQVELKEVVHEDAPPPLTTPQIRRLNWLEDQPESRMTAELRDERAALAAAMDRGEVLQPKYGEYQLPGGEAYKEMLLTLPVKDRSPLAEYLQTFPHLTSEIRTVGDVADAIKYNAQFRENVKGMEPQAVLDEIKAIASGARSVGQGRFVSSHWDEPNVLAHIRMNERSDAEGRRLLHVEELQSDWGQLGRKHGFQGEETSAQKQLADERGAIANRVADLPRFAEDRTPQQEAEYIAGMSRITDINRQLASSGRNAAQVPDMPFKSSWPELSMKRIIRHAAELGMDGVSWTPGEAQAARYDLSKQVDHISYSKSNDGAWSFDARKNRESLLKKRDLTLDGVSEVLGKDIAKKMEDGVGHEIGAPPGSGELRGIDLKVGGEGMKAFYDRMIPNIANGIGKKFGVKVGKTKLDIGPDEKAMRAAMHQGDSEAIGDASAARAIEVPYLPINQKMRNSVMQGQPLFTSGGGLSPATSGDKDQRRQPLQPAAQ